MPHDGVAVLKHHAVYPHVHTKPPDIKSCFTAYCIIKPLLPRHVIGLCKSMHPWECVSDSQAIKKLSDVESVLHIYMCTLDDYSDAATLFGLCSDSLHCNSCTQNLYRTCVYVAVCINSTPQLGLRLNRLPLCMNTRLVHAAWTEKCASAGNHDWALCFHAYITYNLSLSYATIESSGYFYNGFCHSTGKSYYMPSWLAMKFVSINAVLYTAHVIRRFISNAEVPDSKLDACTARLACFLS